MDVFKLAFETTIVGLLTFVWLGLATYFLFPDFLKTFFDWFKTKVAEDYQTPFGVGALILAYCLGSAILPISNQLVNDEHWPLNQDGIRCQVFVQQEQQLEYVQSTSFAKDRTSSLKYLQPHSCSYWGPVFNPRRPVSLKEWGPTRFKKAFQWTELWTSRIYNVLRRSSRRLISLPAENETDETRKGWEEDALSVLDDLESGKDVSLCDRATSGSHSPLLLAACDALRARKDNEALSKTCEDPKTGKNSVLLAAACDDRRTERDKEALSKTCETAQPGKDDAPLVAACADLKIDEEMTAICDANAAKKGTHLVEIEARCDEFKVKKILTLFLQQETAVLNQGSDKTEGLRQLHERIVVLRGAIFSGFALFLFCVAAYLAPVNGHIPVWPPWKKQTWGYLLGAIFLLLAARNGYEDLKNANIFDIPVLEGLLLVISVFGFYVVWKGVNTPLFQTRRYVLIAIFFTGLTYGGWLWSEILYDQQVISSFAVLPKDAETQKQAPDQ